MTPIKLLIVLWLLLAAGCAPLSSLLPAAPVAQGNTVQPEPDVTALPVAPPLLLSAAQQQQFALAKQQLQAGDYPQAIQLFGALAVDAPGFAGIWYNLALAQWHNRQADAARDSLQQAVTVAPQHSDSHNLLGVLARQRGELRAAERHFKQALESAQPYVAAHKNLAFLYELYLDAPLQAHYHYQQYYQLTQDEQAKTWLALLEQELARQENSNE